MRLLKIKHLFLLFTLITLITSDLIKTQINFIYQSKEREALLEIASSNIWLVIFCLFTLVVVFISSLCSGIFIKFFGKLNNEILEQLKIYIYIIYFMTFTMINLFSALISLIINRGLTFFEVNIINLFFFFVLTFLLFLLTSKTLTTKRSLTICFTIFIINSIIPLIYIFTLFF